MAKTANVHVRMDEQIKNDAVKVFDALGITVAEAITMFFRQAALKNGIPFELTEEFDLQKNESGSIFNEVYTKGLLVYRKGSGVVNE